MVMGQGSRSWRCEIANTELNSTFCLLNQGTKCIDWRPPEKVNSCIILANKAQDVRDERNKKPLLTMEDLSYFSDTTLVKINSKRDSIVVVYLIN